MALHHCGVDDRYPNGQCRPCKRATIRAYKQAHPEAERRRQVIKESRRPNIRQLYPLIRRAQNTVGRMIRDGRLVRPDRCEECGTACKPDAAHLDYNKPQKVRWLCRRCHSMFDKQHPKRPF